MFHWVEYFSFNQRLQSVFIGFILLFTCNLTLASINGVKTIAIEPSKNNKGNRGRWLQVSEVVATEAGSQKDLAHIANNAVTESSSTYSKKSHSNNAISGIGPDRYPNIFHSGSGDKAPQLKITLSHPSKLDSITLFGRADGNSKRDIYDLTLRDEHGKVILKQVGLNATSSSHAVKVDFTGSNENSVAIMDEPLKSLNTQSKRKKIAAKYLPKPVTSREKDYYRNLFKKGLKEVEEKNFDSAVKFFDLIIFDRVNYTPYSIAKSQHDYWIKSAEREKKHAYALKNIDRSKELYDEETIKQLNIKATTAYIYNRDYPLAKKLYRKIMDHTLEYSPSYNSAKRELEGMDAYIAKRKAQDEKNKILADKIRARQKYAQELTLHNKEKRKHEQAKAAELRHQVIQNNNKRYPLKNLQVSSMINYEQMEIGKTKKGEAIAIYGALLKDLYAKEVEENDISFMLRQVLSGPRVHKKSLLVNQSSFKIHDNVTLQCFKYSGKNLGKVVNDCLYFYKDTLVGGRFYRGFKTQQSILDLLPYFPVKDHYAKNDTYSRLERSNNTYSLKSLTGGFTATTKTTRKNALTPLGITSYSNKNYTVGLICISPKKLDGMLAEFNKAFSYSCH